MKHIVRNKNRINSVPIYIGTEQIRKSGVTNYFQINEDGGTGGGIFTYRKKLYK